MGSLDDDFSDFVRSVEPRLQRALVAAWGMELGREAASNALVYAWRHWKRVQSLDNPAGYLYRVVHRSVKRRSVPQPSLAVRGCRFGAVD
ncbi:MAG: hypothetical protein ACE5MI_10195 [Acidimicrobiia bacterium]